MEQCSKYRGQHSVTYMIKRVPLLGHPIFLLHLQNSFVTLNQLTMQNVKIVSVVRN